MAQSTVDCLRRFVLAAVFTGLAAHQASALTLKPWKDELFAYGTVVETADDGALRVVDYEEMRDINGRDQVPERRVKSAYVSTAVKKATQALTVDTPAGKLDVAMTGKGEGAAFTVIFIHGRGGDRRLGNNDWTFGGNFNRLKNLAVQNGGVYYAPSVPSFDDAGAARISGLILRAKALSPDAPVILACASMGSFICARVVRDATAVKSLSGMVLMGGAADGDYAKTPAFKAKLPVYFTHGDSDKVYAANDQIAVFRKLRKAGIPTRFVLFQTGGHGTPVRMTDWRETLNFLLAR
ncbi:phospholipase [Shinella sumterensis]|uniref:alpha/beta hydrolase n=1 Tax=Shinella sumterensis TaxID=1967501 RepID=UPI00106E23E3|nr:alpha/beta hydrolase [Shinella sumterensis]MCD1266463.1 alpha/beta hydrolase [Shinella sumterensis]TFE94815.1 phospholipase [Shinella sumterensis]